MFDQVYHAIFHQKLNLVHYKTCLTIIGTVWRASKEITKFRFGASCLKYLTFEVNDCAFTKILTKIQKKKILQTFVSAVSFELNLYK